MAPPRGRRVMRPEPRRIRGDDGKLKYVKPFAFDPNPLFASETGPPDPVTGIKPVFHWMAFDPRYGPESEAQIEWHERAGHLDTSDWEVGKPCAIRRRGAKEVAA